MQHLGAVLSRELYISDKVKLWTSTILNLSLIAKTQPHAAYCAFVHGVYGLWTFFLCTIPDISPLLQPLEDAVRLHFIPSITGRDGINDTERDLFSLPSHLGGSVPEINLLSKYRIFLLVRYSQPNQKDCC